MGLGFTVYGLGFRAFLGEGLGGGVENAMGIRRCVMAG